jgi:hypothetical protein
MNVVDWWTVFLAAASLGVGVAVHFFGQGLRYMAVAEQRWDVEASRWRSPRYYRWHRGFGRVVALLVAPAVAAGMFLGLRSSIL